jgi:hypothetical protein
VRNSRQSPTRVLKHRRRTESLVRANCLLLLVPASSVAEGAERSCRRRHSMLAPVPLGDAESGDCTKHEKDQTQKKVTRTPEEACAEERQDAEHSKVARFSVHSRPRMTQLCFPKKVYRCDLSGLLVS